MLRAAAVQILVVALALAGLEGAAIPAKADSGPGGSTYVAVTQTRVLDTGSGVGLPSGTPTGSVLAGHSLTLQVTGIAGVPPTGVTAVALNLTVRAPSAAGYLVAYAAGVVKPPTSSLNYAAGQSIANLAIVPLSTDGKITIATSATTEIVGDLSGYYVDGAPSGAGSYREVGPVRALDTRTGAGRPAGTKVAPVPAGSSISLQIDGLNGIPSSGVAAVAVNLTVVRPAAAGYLVPYADGTPTPPTSSLNYAAGQTVANLTMVAVGADGAITIRTSASTEIVADVVGYVEAGASAADGGYAPSTPARIADTRVGAGAQPVGKPLAVKVAGVDGLPSQIAAVAVTVTVTHPTASGYLVAAPLADSTPATSTLNFAVGHVTANFAIIPVSANGAIEILASASTQIVVDIVGYVAGASYGVPSPLPIGGLTATPSRSSVALTWTDPAVPEATSLMIRRTLGSTPPASILDGSLLATLSPTTTRYIDPTVSPQNSYSYAVFAYTAPLWSPATTTQVSTLPLTWGTPRSGEMDAVSCATSTMCVAVNHGGTFTRFTGSYWTTPRRIASTVTNVGAISCPRSNFCLTLDRVTGTAWSYDGSGWKTRGAAGKYTGDIVCTSSTACVADGSNPQGHVRAWIMSGSTWTVSSSAPSSTNYGSTGMSCAAGICAFITYYGVVTQPPTPDRLFLLTGSTWRSMPLPQTYGGAYDDVSCYSAALCYILGQFGSVIYRNGRLTALASHNNDQYEGAVSCVSSATCIVGMWDGTARVFNGTSLGTAASVVDTSTSPQPSVLDISCVGPTFCAAVGWFGVNTTTP